VPSSKQTKYSGLIESATCFAVNCTVSVRRSDSVAWRTASSMDSFGLFATAAAAKFATAKVKSLFFAIFVL